MTGQRRPAPLLLAIFSLGVQHLCLQRPGCGTSYLTCKIRIEELMAEWAIRNGGDFTVNRFFHGFFAAGVIPVVPPRCGMTGSRDEVLNGS